MTDQDSVREGKVNYSRTAAEVMTAPFQLQKNKCLGAQISDGAICAVRAEDDQQGETLTFTCSSSSIILGPPRAVAQRPQPHTLCSRSSTAISHTLQLQ